MLTNRTQSQVSISGLTYNNLVQDAYNAIKDSDEFKNSFSTFTSNEAARMIVELYAYVANQLANRMDQMGNELFVDTATGYGLSRLLKLVGAQVDFPAAAEVKNVEVRTTATSDTIILSRGIGTEDDGEDLVFIPDAFKSVTANNGTNWEFIRREIGEDGEYIYNYTSRFTFTAPVETYTLYEGTTHSYEYTIRSVNPDIIDLPDSNVIKDSVRVYYKQKVLSAGTDNAYEIKEFKKVDNFFTTAALSATTGIYTARNMGNGNCELCLKPYHNEDNSENDIGKELLIMYRTGGGEDGNIAVGSIYKTERFNTISGTRVTGVGELTIENKSSGSGGKDELTADEIRSVVVNEVRNTKIAITEEDYEYLLPKYDTNIQLLKCYGEKNEEIADLAETYGYYVNPIAVWLIILKYNKDFYDAYMNGEEGLTDRINDISFNTLDINPRFDEQYQINTADINQIYKAEELKTYYTAATNQYKFPINSQGVEILSKKGASITVTNAPYVDSASVDRRGVHCFDRYDVIPGVVETWEDFCDLGNISVGEVYRVEGPDADGICNSRFECIKAIEEGGQISDWERFWKKLDFDYIYDNLITENASTTQAADPMYVQQSAGEVGSFSTVCSVLDSAYKANWDDIKTRYGLPVNLEGITLIIDGIPVVFTDNPTFSTLNALANFINAKQSAITYHVVLNKDIAGSTVPSAEVGAVSLENLFTDSSTGIVIKLASGGSDRNITVDVSGVTTYGGLKTAINNALAAASLGDKIFCDFYPNTSNDCYDLWLISPEGFSYKDASAAGDNAIYKVILNHPDYDNTWLDANKFQIDDETLATTWAAYLTSDATPIVKANGNYLEVLFDDIGNASIQIEGANAGPLREIFGFAYDDNTVNSKKDRREITALFVSGESGNNSAYVIINVSSDTDTLNEDIYINIFGQSNDEIILGSYYEHIADYLPADTSDTIIDLLTRGPIKALYSTSYTTGGTNPVIDKYGCSYQIKFSTGLVEEQTYNELSSNKFPAYVTTTKFSYDTFRIFDEDEVLYIKVDGIDYDGTGSFKFTSDGESIEVGEEKGYAKFYLSWFNSHNALDFINAITKTFEAQGEGGTPLLDSVAIEEDYIKLYTKSTAYYSSINFGDTVTSIISYLFGINDSVVHSKEGQINVEQITYSYYSLTNYPALGKTMKITYTAKGNDATPTEKDVPIGYSLSQFTDNVALAFPNGQVLVNNNRLILTDLSDGAKIKVDISWESQVEKSSWQNMFTELTWKQFIVDEDPYYNFTTDTVFKEDKTYYIEEGGEYVEAVVIIGAPVPANTYYERSYIDGSASLEFVNSGDYYIELTTDSDGNNVYTLKVENPINFPLGNIYAHMYEDYSFDHIISSDENGIEYTDEYNWNRLMTNKRVMLTEHIYKQPRFIPFDLAITCRLPNTETFLQKEDEIKENLESFLRKEYGVYSDNIGKEILADDIILNIKNSFSNIKNVLIDYMGYDMLLDSTNKSKLETKFNQQHIIASNAFSEEPVINESGVFSYQIVNTHGLKITLKYSA